MKIEPSDYVMVKFTHPTDPKHTLEIQFRGELYDVWAPVLRALDTVINEMREKAQE